MARGLPASSTGLVGRPSWICSGSAQGHSSAQTLECQLHSQSQLWVARQGQGTNLTAHHYPQSHLQAVADLLVEWLSSLSWAAWQVLQTMQACLQAASGVLFLVLLAQGTSAAGVPGASGTGGNGRGTIAKS